MNNNKNLIMAVWKLWPMELLQSYKGNPLEKKCVGRLLWNYLSGKELSK